MEFKHEELVEREKEIGRYLLKEFSLTLISEKTGLSKRTLSAHIKNMMTKLKAENTGTLLKLLQNRIPEK